jgi:hypothetical protein
VVDDVLAVCAARPRRKVWRSVNVGNTQTGKVGYKVGGMSKSEVAAELQTISG